MRMMAVAAAGLALAACGGSETLPAEGEAISQEQAAASAAEIVRPEPGEYRMTFELIDISLPNIPGVNADNVRGMMEGTLNRQTTTCITPEQAERGFEDMLRQSQEGHCDFQRFDVAGGDIDAAMTCRRDGNEARIKVDGTVTRTSSDMTMTMDGTAPQIGEIEMTLRTQSERIGECAA